VGEGAGLQSAGDQSGGGEFTVNVIKDPGGGREALPTCSTAAALYQQEEEEEEEEAEGLYLRRRREFNQTIYMFNQKSKEARKDARPRPIC